MRIFSRIVFDLSIRFSQPNQNGTFKFKKTCQSAMVNLISAVNAHFMLRSNQIQKIRQIKA